MSWKDDNFWKQVKSFKGCGQNDDRVSPWRIIFLLFLVVVIIGTLVAAGLEFF